MIRQLEVAMLGILILAMVAMWVIDRLEGL